MIKYLGLPLNASKHGQGIDNLVLYVHILMGVLFVGWLAYFLYTLVRFRKSRNPKADYVGVKGHLSSYLEGVVAVVEAVLLIGFAIPLWGQSVSQFPKPEEATVIKIVAQQFLWNGRYSGPDTTFGKNNIKFISSSNPFGLDPNDPAGKDDFNVQGEIVVPVDKPVLVHISSLDVIHSFDIHPMRVAQDAMPGLNIPAWFHPVKTGRYLITCAQLCGNSHYGMKGYLKVVSAEEYATWLATQSKKAGSSTTSYE